jgi:TPR repeat protein
LASTTLGQKTVSRRVVAGDHLTTVRKLHGSPKMEYPLNGNLVQEYAQCTVASRNGVVISAKYNENADASDKPTEQKNPPTIDAIKILAGQGDCESQYLLAYCFQLGKVTEQNYDAAVKWYTKAAMQGHMPSQHNLGYLYLTGKGVEKDYVQAYMWALLAADNGNDTVKKAVVHRLTPAQKLAGELGAEEIKSRIKTPSVVSKNKEG